MKLLEPSLLALGLSCCLPAFADSPADADGTSAGELAVVNVNAEALDDESYQARSASTATRSSAPLIETPQAVNVVSRQVLQDQQAATLDDALANVSGITQGNTLANTWDSFMRRGFGSRDDGSILVDGIRSALPRNYSVSTDHVEVLKGPASLLYGIQEPGGVINVITKKPEYTQAGSVTLGSSAFGGGSGSFDVTGPIADTGLAYRVLASAENSDYWRNFGTIRRRQIAPSLAWRDGATRIRLAYEYMSYSVPYDRGTLFVNGKPLAIPRERRLDESWNQANGTTQSATASIEHDLDASWRVQANLGWSSLRYDDNQARPVSYNAKTGILTRSADGNRDFNDNNLLATGNLLGDVRLWGLRHEVLFGLDIERDSETKGDALRGKSTGGFNVFDPVYGVLAEPSIYSASKSNTRTVIDSQAVLGKDSIHLGERWIAVGGLRYQHYRQEDGSGNPYVVTGRASGNVALPQLGVVYRLAPAVSLYANYSESFKPNSSVDTGGPFEPERGVVHEAGIKYEDDRFSANAAVYRIVKRNVLVTENDVSRTVGRVRSQGVELDVSGRLTRRLSLIASYALTDAVVLEDEADYVGKQPFNVARHTASTFLSYAMPGAGGDRWRFGGGARYVGRRQGDALNSFSLDPYTLFDLFASWQTRVQGHVLEIQANIKNLLDSTYYTSTSGSSLQVNVGTPRELTTQARLLF
ncbi:TonB-dependent siderophore receptor [Paludibacterium yongneupense]|uniref:TonB-dependent siderophore receptor n=1 Tax=Paludibacterium yongneupense TaxID=400061 RepID=UPI000429C79E|nr:TonB-dependent siderophore receptor [Paludibacterium yongneupense]